MPHKTKRLLNNMPIEQQGFDLARQPSIDLVVILKSKDNEDIELIYEIIINKYSQNNSNDDPIVFSGLEFKFYLGKDAQEYTGDTEGNKDEIVLLYGSLVSGYGGRCYERITLENIISIKDSILSALSQIITDYNLDASIELLPVYDF